MGLGELKQLFMPCARVRRLQIHAHATDCEDSHRCHDRPSRMLEKARNHTLVWNTALAECFGLGRSSLERISYTLP